MARYLTGGALALVAGLPTVACALAGDWWGVVAWWAVVTIGLDVATG